MSITIVATPIGNPLDISQRAIQSLQNAELIIGEEFKELSKLLKSLNIEKKELRVLNEHSTEEDITSLRIECQTKNAAFVSDCGTPNFCDPGFQLIKECRKYKIGIKSIPGASSLMMILSLTSERIYDFYFKGFLPANSEERGKALVELKKTYQPMILMDTPYRLKKLLQELQNTFPQRKMLLGLDMTLENELILEGTAADLIRDLDRDKAEFMLLIYQDKSIQPREPKARSPQAIADQARTAQAKIDHARRAKEKRLSSTTKKYEHKADKPPQRRPRK